MLFFPCKRRNLESGEEALHLVLNLRGVHIHDLSTELLFELIHTGSHKERLPHQYIAEAADQQTGSLIFALITIG